MVQNWAADYGVTLSTLGSSDYGPVYAVSGVFRSLDSRNNFYHEMAIRREDALSAVKAILAQPDQNDSKWADEAKKLVYGDRNKQYGNPLKDYTRVSQVWTGLLSAKLKDGVVIEPREAIMMMVALKLCRNMEKHKDDNVIDAHGYLEVLEWAERELAEQKEQPNGNG